MKWKCRNPSEIDGCDKLNSWPRWETCFSFWSIHVAHTHFSLWLLTLYDLLLLSPRFFAPKHKAARVCGSFLCVCFHNFPRSTVSINWYFLNCNVNTQVIVVFAAKAAEEWRQGVSNYFQYWGVISQSQIAIFPPRHSPPIQKYLGSQPGLSNVKVSRYTP